MIVLQCLYIFADIQISIWPTGRHDSFMFPSKRLDRFRLNILRCNSEASSNRLISTVGIILAENISEFSIMPL